jgi:uncharacterized protein YkwD
MYRLLMMPILLISAALPLMFASAAEDDATAKLDRDEAKQAFEYLNKVRAAPSDFSKEIGADLKDIKPSAVLKWNDALAKAAEDKALDMATRDYFSHTTPEGKGMNIFMNDAGYKLPDAWLKDKKDNYFESIAAGSRDGVSSIRDLILDKDDTNLGHRKHLLAMDDFRAKHKDIGIGFARSAKSKYKTYVSILIAHQN